MEWLDLAFHNKSDIEAFLKGALPLVEDTFATAVAITEATNSAQGYLLLGSEFSDAPVSSTDVISKLRGGVPSSIVYQRQFVDFWTALKKGRSINDALGNGVSRIREMVDTDVERIADLTQIEKFANEHKIVGYRRVLYGPVNCALCIVASTQRYHRSQLKPIHPHCDCKVAPVLSFESDGDQILDQDLLDQIHQDIQSKFGTSDRSGRTIDYRKIMVEYNHGEIGPYLSYRGDHFTSL